MESHGVDTSAQPPALSNQRWQRRQQQQQQQHAEQKMEKRGNLSIAWPIR